MPCTFCNLSSSSNWLRHPVDTGYLDIRFSKSRIRIFCRYRIYVRGLTWRVSGYPLLEGDIQILQKRFVRIISGLRSKSYHEKLEELEILSLEARRVYFDLIKAFMWRGYSKVKYEQWFQLEGDLGRGLIRARTYPLWLNIIPTSWVALDIRLARHPAIKLSTRKK